MDGEKYTVLNGTSFTPPAISLIYVKLDHILWSKSILVSPLISSGCSVSTPGTVAAVS